MFYLKSVSLPNVSKFHSVTFQGFNKRVYYMDTEGNRHSCPMSDVSYEAYFGKRYISDTQMTYLMDPRLADILLKFGEDDYSFLCNLYSEREMLFSEDEVRFNYEEKFSSPDIMGFEYVPRTDRFSLASEHHDYIKEVRSQYLNEVHHNNMDHKTF